MKYTRLLILLVLLSLTLCFSAYAQKHGIKESPLDQPYDTMIEAYKNLNAELLKQVYYESALYLSPSREQKINKGLPSFIGGFEGMFRNAKEKKEDLILSFKRERREDLAVDVGYYKLEIIKDGQVQGTSYGKFITLLIKDNRSSAWKFNIDGYNDSPAIDF